MRLTLELLSAVGKAVEVKESQMDLITALSGSGPAYVFHLIEALVAAGVKEGLSPETAALLVSQTVYGAARMALETGKTPEALRVQVTSPGGTTEAGLAAMDQGGFTQAVEAAIRAATQRGAELRHMNE